MVLDSGCLSRDHPGAASAFLFQMEPGDTCKMESLMARRSLRNHCFTQYGVAQIGAESDLNNSSVFQQMVNDIKITLSIQKYKNKAGSGEDT